MEASLTEHNALFNIEMQTEYFGEPMDVETQPIKGRKKSSIVWEHFTIKNVGEGERRAFCKKCERNYAYSKGSKNSGTSHLKRHIAKGVCPFFLQLQDQDPSTSAGSAGHITDTPIQSLAYIEESKNLGTNHLKRRNAKGGCPKDTPKQRYRTSTALFDPDRCRHEIAQMVILHDYPLHMVEHKGFMTFTHNLQPNFNMVNFSTVQGDCVTTYLREKQTIHNLIDQMPGRMCLTLDLWNSNNTTGYIFIRGQFIDNECKIQKRLLNVVMEPYPESDSAISHAVSTCLSDWNIEGRLFSVTINQPLSETGIINVQNLLLVKNPRILNGQLLLTNCLARSLSSIAQEALKVGQETVKKVRDSVKFVKTSELIEGHFLALKQQLQVLNTRNLSLDDQTQWNTTYEMLLGASELKEVFSCLDTLDTVYIKSPSDEEWKLVEKLCTHLKMIYDTANLLTSSSVPTANTFFHEAWKLELELTRAATSEDKLVSSLTNLMLTEFDKYWTSSCLVLAIAVVMDPRFKMKLVEFSFTKIYGDEAASYINIVDEGIHELFLEYVNGEDMQCLSNLHGPGLGLTDYDADFDVDFDVYIMKSMNQELKSELDQYLEEPLLPRSHEFVVMRWWKLYESKYPTLSKMALDILTIPVSTVDPESVFDTSLKEMDSSRCSLRPETVEALFCAKDWLRSEPTESMESLVKMEFPI